MACGLTMFLNGGNIEVCKTIITLISYKSILFLSLLYIDAENILFLKYEDMKKDLAGSVKAISEFMGYTYDDSVLDNITKQCTFESMKSDPLADPDTFPEVKGKIIEGTSFLRKGEVGDWRNCFSDEQSARLDAEYAKRMVGSGLNISFQ